MMNPLFNTTFAVYGLGGSGVALLSWWRMV